jgi:hypothetical protein
MVLKAIEAAAVVMALWIGTATAEESNRRQIARHH